MSYLFALPQQHDKWMLGLVRNEGHRRSITVETFDQTERPQCAVVLITNPRNHFRIREPCEVASEMVKRNTWTQDVD